MKTTMKEIKVDRITITRDFARVVILGLPDVPGVAANIFSTLARRRIGVEMILQNTMRGGRTDMTFLVKRDRLDGVVPICQELSEKTRAQGVSYDTEIACLTLTAEKLPDNPQLLAQVFTLMASVDINIEIITSGPAGITFIIDSTRAGDAVAELEKTFLVPAEILR